MITQINIFIILFNIFLAFYIIFVNSNQNENFTTQTPNMSPCDNNYLDTCSYDASHGSENRNICKKECINTNDISCDEQVCHEKCFDEKCSKWVSNQCIFQPYGTKIELCIKHCLNKKECNYIKCKNICYSCKKPEDCLWYKKNENSNNNIILQSQETEYIDPTKPLKVTIFSDIINDGHVKISFPPPFIIKQNNNNNNLLGEDEEQIESFLQESTPNSTGITLSTQTPISIDTSKIDEQVNPFMYTILKTQNKREGTRLGTYFMSTDDKKKRESYNKQAEETPDNLPDIPIIEFVIKNLDKNEFYDISIRGYNKNTNKISPSSNIIMVKPNKKIKEKIPRLRKNNTKDTQELMSNSTPETCKQT